MAHPTVLLAGLVCALILFGSGVKTGIDWQQGRDAIELSNSITAAVAQAKVESAEQMKVALKNAERRSVFRAKQQKLEQELAKDEKANDCHISSGTLGMLNRIITDANKTLAGGVNDSLRVDPKPAGFLRGGFSSVDWLLGARLPRVQPEATRFNRLD